MSTQKTMEEIGKKCGICKQFKSLLAFKRVDTESGLEEDNFENCNECVN